MIIACPKCKKKFDIEDSLIPEKGRLLQCSSCDKKWFFKKTIDVKKKIERISIKTKTNKIEQATEDAKVLTICLESSNLDKNKKAIDEINTANMKQIPKWITENPTYADDEEYMKIISNIMKMDAEQDKEKIINNVAQQTLIDE